MIIAFVAGLTGCATPEWRNEHNYGRFATERSEDEWDEHYDADVVPTMPNVIGLSEYWREHPRPSGPDHVLTHTLACIESDPDDAADCERMGARMMARVCFALCEPRNDHYACSDEQIATLPEACSWIGFPFWQVSSPEWQESPVQWTSNPPAISTERFAPTGSLAQNVAEWRRAHP